MATKVRQDATCTSLWPCNASIEPSRDESTVGDCGQVCGVGAGDEFEYCPGFVCGASAVKKSDGVDSHFFFWYIFFVQFGFISSRLLSSFAHTEANLMCFLLLSFFPEIHFFVVCCSIVPFIFI